MKLISILTLLILQSLTSHAFDVGLGVVKPFDKTQVNSGADESDPFSPNISLGHQWDFFGGYVFAPRFGYTRYTNTTNDRYGGDYTIESFYLLYDFLSPLSNVSPLYLRYGIGTFQKKIKGEGGAVTIPNGNGTATAYRPDSSKSTATLSLNLGIDYKLGSYGMTVKDQGIRGELFIIQPLDKYKRMFSMMAEYVLFF